MLLDNIGHQQTQDFLMAIQILQAKGEVYKEIILKSDFLFLFRLTLFCLVHTHNVGNNYMCVQMKEVEGGHMVLTLTSNTFFVVQKKPTNIFHNFLYSFSLGIFYIFFIAILIGGEFVFLK